MQVPDPFTMTMDTLQMPNESMTTGSHFDEVNTAIDDIVATLKGESWADVDSYDWIFHMDSLHMGGFDG